MERTNGVPVNEAGLLGGDGAWESGLFYLSPHHSLVKVWVACQTEPSEGACCVHLQVLAPGAPAQGLSRSKHRTPIGGMGKSWHG